MGMMFGALMSTWQWYAFPVDEYHWKRTLHLGSSVPVAIFVMLLSWFDRLFKKREQGSMKTPPASPPSATKIGELLAIEPSDAEDDTAARRRYADEVQP